MKKGLLPEIQRWSRKVKQIKQVTLRYDVSILQSAKYRERHTDRRPILLSNPGSVIDDLDTIQTMVFDLDLYTRRA